MTKYLILIVLLISNSLSASEFEEAFDISANGFSRQANRIVTFMNSSEDVDETQQIKEFDYISKSLVNAEKNYNNNAVYWFTRGLHAKNLASFYQQQDDMALVNSSITDKNEFYLKAMEYDKKYEPHLSARAYAAMKAGLPEKFKQKAIQTELDLGGSGESDAYYWYLHWSNVNELQKQGRMKEADEALARMKKELNDSGKSSEFDALVKKIDKEMNEIKSELSKKQSAVRDHKAFTEEKVEDQYYQYLIIIAGIMLLLIIAALVIELMRRKLKNKNKPR